MKLGQLLLGVGAQYPVRGASPERSHGVDESFPSALMSRERKRASCVWSVYRMVRSLRPTLAFARRSSLVDVHESPDSTFASSPPLSLTGALRSTATPSAAITQKTELPRQVEYEIGISPLAPASHDQSLARSALTENPRHADRNHWDFECSTYSDFASDCPAVAV